MSFFSPAAFEEAILHLSGRTHREYAGELQLADVVPASSEVARALSVDVLAMRHRVKPAEIRTALTDGKTRVLYRSTTLDAIVERALSRLLLQVFEPLLSPHLYSYRENRSTRDALRAFGRFTRMHRAMHVDPRSRGLYVLRRDVKSYGESIPVDRASRLWSLLDEALSKVEARDRKAARVLLEQLLPREHLAQDASVKRSLVGTPTGSTIQPFLNNLYLSDVDRELSALGFYARFGDDLLFASESEEQTRRASLLLDEKISALSLSLNTAKTKDLFFNGAGAARHGADGYIPTDKVDYLGLSVSFGGHARVRNDKWRAMVRTMHHRMERALDGVTGHDVHERASILVQTMGVAFDARDALSIGRSAELVDLVDDRDQLRALDHLIVLRTAELATRIKGVRAFRVLPPRVLYEMGLVSLIQKRNRRAKTNAP